jgi:hypothetical protein
MKKNPRNIIGVKVLYLFPEIDKKSNFYKNCKRQRKAGAKICQDCPFRKGIEEQEEKNEIQKKTSSG